MRGRAPQIVANQVSDKTKQPSRNSVYRKKTHTHTERRGQWLCWSDDKLYWCFSPLLSRSAVRRRGRRGRFLFLCLYFFLYPVDPVTGARASVCVWSVRPSSLSLSQLERTRAVHVTSRLAEQTSEARRGRCRALTDPAYYL